MAGYRAPGPVGDRARQGAGLAVYVPAQLLSRRRVRYGLEQHGVRARGDASCPVDPIGPAGAGAAEIQDSGAGGGDRQAAERRLEDRRAHPGAGRQGRGPVCPEDPEDENGGIAVAARVRPAGPGPGELHDMDVRAESAGAQADRVRGDAGTAGAARIRVSPLQGILEGRALKQMPSTGAGAVRPRLFHLGVRTQVSQHDEPLLRHHRPFSQRCRIVLYEKGMDFQIIDVDMYNKPEDIAVMNPYNRLPVLVERDLILYEANIINEYIDERFPHPQLMPADPVMRARARLFLF